MHNQQVAGPRCDKLVSIPIPDGKDIAEVSFKHSVFSFRSWADQKKICPHCKHRMYIWFKNA